MNNKIYIFLLIMILTLTGCSVPYSDFSRDLLISNQEIVEETVETTDTTSTTDRETVVIATGEWAPFCRGRDSWKRIYYRNCYRSI